MKTANFSILLAMVSGLVGAISPFEAQNIGIRHNKPPYKNSSKPLAARQVVPPTGPLVVEPGPVNGDNQFFDPDNSVAGREPRRAGSPSESEPAPAPGHDDPVLVGEDDTAHEKEDPKEKEEDATPSPETAEPTQTKSFQIPSDIAVSGIDEHPAVPGVMAGLAVALGVAAFVL
ncbi:hypothetical protein F4819DRAFT_486636 [Hypoxylon fuscum]|nr:hypothetical protein F4819DRAFT_486636 [Hypoxylon fuscum]